MEKILIIEDDFAIRQSVDFALRRAGYEVRSLESGQRAAELIARFAPQLIILDIMLPHTDGLEICETLRHTDTETIIIMVSALGEEQDRVKGLLLGADDYLVKPFSLQELLARVQANLRRLESGALSAGVGAGSRAGGRKDPLCFGALRIEPRQYRAYYGEELLALRAKEFLLLYELARHAGEVLTREVLAQRVWGQEHLHSSRTIDVHVRRLRFVLERCGAGNCIRTAHHIGYCFEPEPESEPEVTPEPEPVPASESESPVVPAHNPEKE